MDWRVSTGRIANVLCQLEAEVIALQEVFGEQAVLLAKRLAMRHYFAATREFRRQPYGNAVLSTIPISNCHTYDLSVAGREPRNCVRCDLSCGGGSVVHVFALHLGTSFFERRKQGQKLLSRDVLGDRSLSGSRIVMGDFNEWTRGSVTRSLSDLMQMADVEGHLGRARTYPGIAPFLHLDHIYYDRSLYLHRLRLHRSFEALLASDHLPLEAEFRIENSQSAKSAMNGSMI
jgi:endonuclease/exonuclease/phosphatase family metal-dependent hydrolase